MPTLTGKYLRGETERAPIWELICRQPLRYPTGSTVQYSDIGYLAES